LAEYELRYIAVDPAARARGIGSMLLRTLEESFPGSEPFFMWVLAARAAAMRFYLRHGFREDYEVDGHVRMIKLRS
jgi:ribosomal protein S18 acetylase RimI-like enzyme